MFKFLTNYFATSVIPGTVKRRAGIYGSFKTLWIPTFANNRQIKEHKCLSNLDSKFWF
jgi:hypothetical protein